MLSRTAAPTATGTPAPLRRERKIRMASAVERTMTFTHRLAVEADFAAIRALIEVAIAHHLKAFLDPAQVELSKSIMGLDTQLIADRTYFLVEENGRLAGCGGWSRRATLYGGDHSTSQRNHALLDIAKDAARASCDAMKDYRFEPKTLPEPLFSRTTALEPFYQTA